MRVRRLVMLRHGQTEYNAGSRMQGQLNSELTDLGRAQAVAAAEVLAKRQPLLIVSSDLHRAYDTAVSLGERTGLPVQIDTRLRETHLGDWQGLTHVEVDAASPGARLAWRDDAAECGRAIKNCLAADSAWRLVVDRQNMAVFLTRERPLPHILLPGQAGVIIGPVFDTALAIAGCGRVAARCRPGGLAPA